MGFIRIKFPNGFVARADVQEETEPVCTAQLYEMLKDGPVPMESYHTLAAGGFFSAYARPPAEPVPCGSQIKSIGNKVPLIYDFEPGDISWLGSRLCFAYGPSTEPMSVGGPVIAVVRDQDLDGYKRACLDVWFHCYIYHKLAIITIERGEFPK